MPAGDGEHGMEPIPTTAKNIVFLFLFLWHGCRRDNSVTASSSGDEEEVIVPLDADEFGQPEEQFR
jgi:hypothetical protein